VAFYDDEWWKLQKKYPLIARKISDLRCESLSFEQYEEEQEILRKKIEKLERQVDVLIKMNGVTVRLEGTREK